MAAPRARARRARVAGVPIPSPFARLVAVVTFACAVAGIVACTDSGAGPSARAAGGPAASSLDGAGRETTPSGGAMRVRPGEQVTFDVVIDPGTSPIASSVPGLSNAFRVGTRVVVWIVAAATDGRAQTSAQFGIAEVRATDDSSVRFTVRGQVPATLWQRRAGGTPGTPVATRPGAYAVVLNDVFRRDLVVVDASPATSTVAATTRASIAPAPTTTADAARRVLGERDLAGVAFGTGEREAMASLSARFGPPSFDEPHRSACGAQRLAGWGDLVVTFRAIGADGTGGAGGAKVLVGYRYSAPHAGTHEGPEGLQTETGLEPGMALDELRVREPAVTFVTDADGPALASWYAGPGRRLAGRLNDDVTAPSVGVVEIASSLATLALPTLADC